MTGAEGSSAARKDCLHCRFGRARTRTPVPGAWGTDPARWGWFSLPAARGVVRRVTLRRVPNRREQIAGLFVLLGAAVVFGPAIWFLGRWREAAARDPGSAPGARWLGEQLSAHPYLTVGLLLLGVALSGGLVMLILVSTARRLTTRLADRGRPDRRTTRG